jgi:N-carbamoyl-L-amino-acid hydrolase
MTAKTNLTINPQRLWDALMETAQFGATPKGGIKRLTVSDEDKRVRDWFRLECEKLGCVVEVDEVGNMFATRPGKRKDVLPIAMGSHLDTQPTGGKFDGVLGVLGALEVMRTLVDMDYQSNAPLMIVNWTNEEGSRFAPAMLCSGVYAGVFTPDYAYAREDRNGVTLGDELVRIGYKGPHKAGAIRFSSMFELHIEQGPILEAENKVIGVVTGVQGMRWYEVTVRGQESHTGATPMGLRKNALLGAARMIEAIHHLGMTHLPGVASVGLIENRPNSRNVVPGEVFFTVDGTGLQGSTACHCVRPQSRA